jgi:hypothetical protein
MDSQTSPEPLLVDLAGASAVGAVGRKKNRRKKSVRHLL